MISGNSQDDSISGLSRIATAFERSRFETLVLRWNGGGLSLRKGAQATAARPVAAGHIVPAPKVGIYRAGESGVTAGLSVAPKALLGFIDVLGEKHPVTAPRAGTVTECCVTDGTFVEYGAPLFRLVEA